MTIGEMRERIQIYRVITPDGPSNIFNPGPDDVEPYAEVWAKREDKAQSDRWGMLDTNAVDRKQFIIRHRADLPGDMAVGHGGVIYKVLGVQDLGNTRKYTMLLAGRLDHS